MTFADLLKQVHGVLIDVENGESWTTVEALREAWEDDRFKDLQWPEPDYSI